MQIKKMMLGQLNTCAVSNIEIISTEKKFDSINIESSIANVDNISIGNLSKDVIYELLHGSAYAEFWVELLDDIPTINGNLYSPEIQDKAFSNPRTVEKIRGGIPGEGEHPVIAKTGNKEVDLENYFTRMTNIDEKRVTHYIVDIRKNAKGKWEQLIRTSLERRSIVKNMLIGIKPKFSIRAATSSQQEGNVCRITNMSYITSDYVYTPSNRTSIAEEVFIVNGNSKQAVSVGNSVKYESANEVIKEIMMESEVITFTKPEIVKEKVIPNSKKIMKDIFGF